MFRLYDRTMNSFFKTTNKNNKRTFTKSRCSFIIQEKEECGVPTKEKEDKQKNTISNRYYI